MDRSNDPSTHVTLLERLRSDPADETAWQEFMALYGSKVSGWCRRWGLQEADVEDLTQIVLLKLVATMRGFTYDPNKSFRAYLKTLTRHALSDFLTGRSRVAPGIAGGDSRLGEILRTIEARDDLERQLEQAFDHELLAAAITRVQARVAPQTWEAFRLTAIVGLKGADAAARIPMRPAQVFVAKRRVRDMLRDEVRALGERALAAAPARLGKVAGSGPDRAIPPKRLGTSDSVPVTTEEP